MIKSLKYKSAGIFILLFFTCGNLLFFRYNTNAQTINNSITKRVLQLPAGTSTFTTDQLGNIYLVSAGGAIKKLNEKLDSVAIYNGVKQFGALTTIDVSNPLRPLVFYGDFSTIVILDRFLSVVNIIDLRKNNFQQVLAAALAYDNQVWIFDAIDNKIKKIDEQGKTIAASADLRQILTVDVPQPQLIVDRNKLLYIYDSVKGIFVFDYFLGFKNHYPVEGWSSFTVQDNGFWGIKNNKLLFMPSDGNTLPAEMMLLGPVKKTSINNKLLYFLKETEIEILNLPQ